MVKKASSSLSERTNFETTVSYVNIKWFDRLVLEDVSIRDPDDHEMIELESLEIDFDISSVISEAIEIDEAIINQATISLKKVKAENRFNINVFSNRIKEMLKKEKKNPNASFSVNKIRINGSVFRLNNEAQDSIKDRFDYNHFEMRHLNAKIKRLLVKDGITTFVLEDLKADDPVSGFTVDNLDCYFSYGPQFMHFENLDFRSGQTELKDSLSFLFEHSSALSYFVDSVTIGSRLVDSKIHSNQLAIFNPAMKDLNRSIALSTIVDGKIGDLSLKNSDIKYGKDTHITGDLEFSGLPNIQETFMIVNLNQSRIDFSDFQSKLSNYYQKSLVRLGKVNFKGNFTGYINDFVANGDFRSELGSFTSDLNLKIDSLTATPSYSGKLTTMGFDVGTYLDRKDLLGTMTMTGTINGEGFQIEDADFDLSADFERIEINGYPFQNISTNSKLNAQLFNGSLKVNDPNLVLSSKSNIDLTKEKIIIDATLEKANLLELGLSKVKSSLSSKLKLNLKGLEIDSIVGNAKFYDNYIGYKDRTYKADTIELLSSRGELRDLQLRSDFLDLQAEGNFDVTTFYRDAKHLFKEYSLIIQNKQVELQEFLNESQREEIRLDTTSAYRITMKGLIKDSEEILDFLVPGLYLSENTAINLDFNKNDGSIIGAAAYIDTLRYNDNWFVGSNLEFDSSKDRDTTNILAILFLDSESHKIGPLSETKDLMVEALWEGDRIGFTGEVYQEKTKNFAIIDGELLFKEDRVNLGFDKSKIHVLEKDWTINANETAYFAEDQLHIPYWKISNENQSVALNGIISKDPSKILNLEIIDFDLVNLNTLVNRTYEGTLNVDSRLKDLRKQIQFDGDLDLKNYKIDGFSIGDITGSSVWEDDSEEFRVNLNVMNTGNEVVKISGIYVPSRAEESQLDLNAILDRAPMRVIEPFFSKYVSAVSGEMNGSIAITGSPLAPVLNGTTTLQDANLKINYLNTNYRLEGALGFEANKIGINKLKLIDQNQKESFWNGGLYHDNFRDFVVDINGDLNNFMVLNTSSTDNELYYGTANITGDFEVLGDFNNLFMNAKARSDKGTKLYFPFAEKKNLTEKDFIKFVDHNQTSEIEEKGKIDLKGINLDFELEITPDAYGEIIFDIKTGDIIRGRGNGNLNLKINTKGDFSLFGDYVLDEGAYNFTLYNIINKEFSIAPNSKISWYGDPYKGIMDIRAYYEQLASLEPVMQNTSFADSSALKRKWPVQVVLDLKGELLNPDIDFDIEVTDFPDQAAVSELKNWLEINEQELKKQVFSLIVLRSFSPENSFNVNSQTIGSSVSEFISNQLSYWITQVDENLEIDVDLGSLDENAFNTFQLRLSYTFLDGRLRVTRDGGFYTNLDNSNNSLAGLAGDWTLEYLLTPDGKFKVKMYSKNNYSQISETLSQTYNTSAGFSLQHTQSFDKLKEIWQGARKSKGKSGATPTNDPSL